MSSSSRVDIEKRKELLTDEEFSKVYGISDIASPDAETTINEAGGKQSHIPVRFDLIDAKALFEQAKVLHEGAVKYGENNWRKIPVEDHLNHALMHIYAYLAGDRTDEHLSHIMCRATFAQAVAITDQENANAVESKTPPHVGHCGPDCGCNPRPDVSNSRARAIVDL